MAYGAYSESLSVIDQGEGFQPVLTGDCILLLPWRYWILSNSHSESLKVIEISVIRPRSRLPWAGRAVLTNRPHPCFTASFSRPRKDTSQQLRSKGVAGTGRHPFPLA